MKVFIEFERNCHKNCKPYIKTLILMVKFERSLLNAYFQHTPNLFARIE